MPAFSADWLALREPADARARSSAIVDTILRGVFPQEPLSIVDLGAGTGANLRYLAPRLGGRQEWLLVDSDPGLLVAAREKLVEWARGLGAQVATDANRISIATDSFSAAVRAGKLDLALELETLHLPHGCLVTASALLDLVSRSWLEELAEACRGSFAKVLFALTYDGRMTLAPPEPDDELARALFNRHQHTDKGFGPALGPEAATTAYAAFADRGYALCAAASDWRLGSDERRLQAELLAGWLAAATEIEPHFRSHLARWSARHARRIAAGESTLVVGHSDLAGIPPG